MRARHGTRRLARAAGLCGLICGILLLGTATAVAANPAKEKIYVKSGGGETERLVAEIYAAALDGPATDGIVQKVANDQEFSVQGDSASVVVAYDANLVAANPALQGQPGTIAEKAAKAVAGHRLVGRTRIQDRPVMALGAALANRLRGAGKPVTTIADFGRAVRESRAEPTILVSPEYGRIFDGALIGMGLSATVSNSSGDLDKLVKDPAFDRAVLVPAGDPRLVAAGATPAVGTLQPLADTENALPSRTLIVLASDQMAQRDPEGRRLLEEVTGKLTPEEVRKVRQRAGSGDPAKAARDWVQRAGLRRSASSSPTRPNPTPTETETGGGDQVDSGLSLPSLLLALAVGGTLAGGLLWTFGWRPAPVGAAGRGRMPGGRGPRGEAPAPGTWADAGAPGEAGPTRRYRTVSPPPAGAAAPSGAEGPLVVGPEPRPIAVHLPRQATSTACGLALDGGLLGGLTVRAASVRGRTHSYRGETRQDAYGVRLSGDEQWVIAAVADGLGSARHADVAAATAIRAALDGVDGALRSGGSPHTWGWRPLITYVSDEIRQATEALGPARQGTNTNRTPIARPATTLTVAVLPADGAGTGVCAAVGDSPAIRVDGGRWQALVGAVHRGGLSDNITTALPGDPGNVEVQTFEWGHSDLLILTSDGFAAGIAGGHTPLAQRLAETWRTPPSLTDFVREVDFRLSTFDDDRTVVALWAGRHDTAVR
ncbi:protein phosphatase 2C domain-containing protein [Thermopolyspora sp. NPDC052614]|uniref:protein phosphatase 2C domain-containing protein n=1 Tax=Thermopolyspora sp. NPDC052614 TaxID=3155682 RepID=UPI003419AE9F